MSSTASQELHRHLAELEQGGVFSHKRLKEMANLVDAISPTPLPVVAVGDAELIDVADYHIFDGTLWRYGANYDADYRQFWWHGVTISLDEVSHVCAAEATTKALNTAAEVSND